MSNLSNSYSDALFEIAMEENIEREILQQSAVLLAAMDENPGFEKLLRAPTVTKDEKEKLVDGIFADKLNRNLLNYLKVMIARGDSLRLRESLVNYEKLYNGHFGIEKAVAVTAVPMSPALQDKLREKLEKITGKKILLTNTVDESCIGGVILQLESMQIDDSIAQKLNTLKNQLKKING